MDRLDGAPVAGVDGVLFSGPEQCDWQDIVFMDIGYRSGLTQPGLMGAHHFVRDGEGLLSDYTTSEFEPRVTLPSDALDTGWRRDGQELWLDPEGDAAFLEVDDAEFEMWPSAKVPACL